MVKAIIFDCFGVLIKDALSELIDPMPDNVKREIHGSLHGRFVGGGEHLHKRLLELLGLTNAEYVKYISENEVKNIELLDFIKQLRKEYKIAMLSNIGKGGIARRFSEDELNTYFDEVVASSDVGLAKPDREIYQLTCDRLGVNFNETIFTDDRQIYIDGAKKLGIKTILFKSNSQFKADLDNIISGSSNRI